MGRQGSYKIDDDGRTLFCSLEGSLFSLAKLHGIHGWELIEAVSVER